MKNKKDLPKFKNLKEEAEFWSTHDSTEYIDYDKGSKAIFPNLKPSTQSISLRLPEHLLYKLKVIAHKKDIPYQSLLKLYLSEKINNEMKSIS